jgi:hypothetical protein
MVPEGPDNRLDKLHRGRCLLGAICSAGKLWLEARQVIGEETFYYDYLEV